MKFKQMMLVTGLLFAVILSGCSRNNSDEVIDVVDVVTPPELPQDITSTVILNVVDRDSLDNLASTVAFIENGSVATNIIDINGEALTEVASSDGIIPFLLAPGATIPEVTVVVTAEQYVKKSFVVDLSRLDGSELTVQLPMIAVTNDIASTSEPTPVVSSEVVETLTFNAIDDDGGAAVSIPAGVTLADNQGNAIAGNSLTIEVVSEMVDSEFGAAIMPEGINPPNTLDVLQPLAVLKVNAFDNLNVPVTRFSSPITFSVTLPNDVTADGQPITSGETFPLYSQSDDSNVWELEASPFEIIEADPSSDFKVGQFTTDHLTHFTALTSNPRCSNSVQLNLTGDPLPPRGLQMSLVSNVLNKTLPITDNFSLTGQQVNRIGIAQDTVGRVIIRSLEGAIWYDSVEDVSFCGVIDAPLVNPANNTSNPVVTVDETLSITLQCSNDPDQTVGVTGAFVLYNTTGRSAQKADGDGAGNYALTGLTQGQNYRVDITYTGELSRITNTQVTILADGQDETVGIAITCPVITGGN